jgi:hypothetical protein
MNKVRTNVEEVNNLILHRFGQQHVEMGVCYLETRQDFDLRQHRIKATNDDSNLEPDYILWWRETRGSDVPWSS